MAVARELARYKLDLLGVQEVRWDKGATVRAGNYIIFHGKGNENYNWRQDCLYTMELYQQFREFVSDRVSYRVLRGRRCNDHCSECAGTK